MDTSAAEVLLRNAQDTFADMATATATNPEGGGVDALDEDFLARSRLSVAEAYGAGMAELQLAFAQVCDHTKEVSRWSVAMNALFY